MLDRAANVKPTNLQVFFLDEATYKFPSFAILASECQVINSDIFSQPKRAAVYMKPQSSLL